MFTDNELMDKIREEWKQEKRKPAGRPRRKFYDVCFEVLKRNHCVDRMHSVMYMFSHRKGNVRPAQVQH